MSHIFDALLKSESDRNGNHGATPASLTEVLRLAEKRAAAEWKPRSVARLGAAGQHEADKSHEAEIALATEEAPASSESQPIAATLDGLQTTLSAPRALPAIVDPQEEPYSVLDHFKRMPVTLSADSRLVVHMEKESAAAEAFRLMAVRLHHIRKDRRLQKVLITSTVPEEGKSMVSANLACTLAAGNRQKVLLLEADVRRPSLTQLFQFSPHPGLCDWLMGTNSLENCIYQLDNLGFWILPSGKPASNPLELIQSPRLSLAVEELRAWFDWIIIDTPPVLPLADTSVLAKLADGILMVTRRGVTQKKLMLRGIEALDKEKLLGAVINSSRKSHHDYYYYGYGSPANTGSSTRSSAL